MTASSSSHQVFIRELISNGSDALEKLRHKLITAGGETAPMEIHLQTDSANGTFTIQVHHMSAESVQHFWSDSCSRCCSFNEEQGKCLGNTMDTLRTRL